MSQQSEASGAARDQHVQQLERLQRNRRWRGVILPFALMSLLLMVLIGVVFSLRTAAQVAVLSDSMLTFLVLCPLTVCMFPLVIGMMTLVGLMGRLHHLPKSPLRRLEIWTAAIEGRVEGWLGRIDERTLQWAVNLAPFRYILGIFEPPSYESQDEGEQ